MMKSICYQIGDENICFDLDGEVSLSHSHILLDSDDNLLKQTPWNKQGFTIQPFLNDQQSTQVKIGLTELISSVLRRVDSTIDDHFSLERYHLYVSDEQHLKLAKLIQHGWNVEWFPIDFSTVESRISELLGRKVSAEAQHLSPTNFDNGLVSRAYKKMCVFNLRIVRPQKWQDNNPPHKDVWIDWLRNAVNIYVPICGSTSKSALPILPGSHFFNEAIIERTVAGAKLNGTSYTVPCVTGLAGEKVKLIRPNPQENEVMIFSPYLIHGGGYNFENDTTRVSLEVRFWAG
jgi:hypothetical protein